MRKLCPFFFLILISVFANASTFSSKSFHSIVKQEIKHDISLPFDMLHDRPLRRGFFEIIPLFHPLLTKSLIQSQIDTTLRNSLIKKMMIPVNFFQGIGLGLGSFIPSHFPPDTNGRPGISQYVQWSGSYIGIFNKTTGQIATGYPKLATTLFTGFGGICENRPNGANMGDGIILYDRFANRWVITYFVFDPPSNTNLQCVAVSVNSNAQGSYYRYAYSFNSIPDYTKIGMWPDAYYMTTNLPNGPQVCAFDRKSMLQGLAASMQCFQLDYSAGVLLPVDLDGSRLPPSGTPGYFMSAFNFSSSSRLALFRFHVDFTNPNNSTLSDRNIFVANFTNACQDTGDNCATQPNTTVTLEVLGDRLMHRLAYQQFQDYGALVATHTIQANNSTGIRWYEIRIPNGSTVPILYQQNTFSPDDKYRFMGSIAMDYLGNIAVGYSISSSTMYPSIAFAARTVTDPLNTLSFEQTILTGTGSQTALQRWGDYTSMATDPIDNCTFWYTNQYLTAQSSGAFYSTAIANFKLPGC